MKFLDARSCRTLLVPDEPALCGGRVAVRRGQLAGETAVFRVNGRRGAMAAGVRAVPHDEVPADVLVVPESLASRLGLHEDAGWQLSLSPAVPLTSLVLEAMVEESADDLWRAVRGGSDLAGQCLWTGVDIGSNVLEIGSRQFRVRGIDETGRDELREIVPSTNIELFLPAARVGLDVVVLADCSGSMEVDDLPVSAESVGWSGTSYQMRLDALKEALLRMLQARLRTAGRESRIALLRFATETEQRFPAGEGMVPLDASSPRDLITGFEQAVRYLNVSGGTDIAGALLRAAELLDRHGKPGNDRLVVLVSDGRPWVAKSADATGEVVFAVDDPVSLMSHLHRRRNIRLHAIGISNNDLYDAWLRRNRYPDRQGLRPDHPLLERLVEVGGGDPTRIGGIDVLEGYFGGLGAGLTRHVGNPAEAMARTLAASTLSLLRQSADDTAERGRAALRRFLDGKLELNDYARRLAGRDLGPWLPFGKSDEIELILSREELLIPVRSQREFVPVLLALHKVIVERGPGRGRGERSTMPAVLNDIYECFREYVVDRLNPLRVYYVHDKTSGSSDDQKILQMCVAALQHYLQVIRIDADDAALWSKLRLCLLEEAAACTNQALVEARRQAAEMGAANIQPPSAAADPGQPSDFSPEFDLRVRN
jgi:von Willebrand factor type A domain